MPAPHFEHQVGKAVARKYDEMLPMTLCIEDRVKRVDFERDARYAGTLLAAAAAAEKAMRGAPDLASFSAASADFVEKLERADQ
ncbi:MAG TPA: hypothetical protein VHF22_15190, partial [Planctomycetota bacterium]|nr:hypothetical protein [Planctomycetota bacterium]